MFGMSIIQVILILLIVIVASWDVYGPQSLFFYQNIPTGLLIGLVLGDWQTGLYIGSAVALMGLGIIGAGGASIPSYFMTTVVATIVGIQTGLGYEAGILIGVPAGMLNIYLDVLIKTVLVYVTNHIEGLVDKGDYKKASALTHTGMILNILQYVIPVCVIIFFGEDVTNAIVNMMPAFVYSGLTVAGKLLPAVGLAALINFMPWQKHWIYMLLGYVLAVYAGFSTMAVSLIGIIVAVAHYKSNSNNNSAVANNGGLEDE